MDGVDLLMRDEDSNGSTVEDIDSNGMSKSGTFRKHRQTFMKDQLCTY